MGEIDRRAALALTIGAVVCGASASAAQRRIDLADGAKVASTRFEFIDNRIFLQATIDGRGPFDMIFDTGGANIVTPEVARAAGLQFGAEFQMGGAGAGTLSAWPTQIRAVACGGVRLSDSDFTILPLETIRDAIGFRALDGLFGYELLRRFTVRINPDAREISFAEPDAAPAAWFDGDRISFDFAERLPRVRGAVAGRTGRFIIDTGDRSSLTLFAPFAAATGLASAARFKGVTGWGVGGPITAGVARFDDLAFGAQSVAGVVTRMPDAQSGAFAGRLASGSIGTGVMKRFDATYDYQRRRIILRRGDAVSARDPVDLAGLWLVERGDGSARRVVAYAVDAGGPAAQAGVAAGDVLITIDGVEAAAIGALALRERFKTAPEGTAFTLGLARGAVRRDARLRLVDRLV